MAKTKKKNNKISAGEAVKILATESKMMKAQLRDFGEALYRVDNVLRDYIGLFEQYIDHTKDGKSFIKKMEKLIKERLDEQKENEQTDGSDTDGDSQDERVGAEGVRAQEG